ncbi:3-hydroxyisobutyrate dehydrogenase [Fomitiporia mediterranea MF3/22]|uniref:3-hydroxyisobutyrate dehydrogenase n=1 Tax=Fomitiporia mediterranea (strain MF3/22) TaxID=694068 RepID=UPI0004408779|nr:3-hydroxyisobutyrate dehydrogenase [Fomitiporia mediterranea MF3/22]EJD07027.1 3-hydroxyisobutyrate dehydrogenase [Fomitiporia mediterranea MF3/22]
MSSEVRLNGQVSDAIGFIGLGNMGWWMAMNLRKKLPKSTKLFIYDVVPSVLDKFSENAKLHDLGEVVICQSSREVAVNSDITFVIVPEGKHVRQVFLDERSGILSGPIGNKTFVDCSTIDPTTSRAVAEAISKSSPSAHFYDAPVSGGILGAEAGVLSFLIGASEDDAYFRQAVKVLLEMMGKNLIYIGSQSQGLVAKLCNNYLSAITNLATAETMNIGMRHGIDPKLLADVIKKSTGSNWSNNNWNPAPGVCPEAAPSKGFKPGFKVQLMVKDLNLLLDSAKEVDAKLALGNETVAAYKATSEDPQCKDMDASVVYRWLGGKE